MKKIVVSIVLVLFVATWASAASSVWRAQKDGAVIYLGGTFHILRDSDFPLPPEFDKAYKASEVLFFETDLRKLQEPSVQQKLLQKALYTDGSTIENHLSPKVYRQLSDYCESRGIPLAALSQFKPAMLMTTLTVLELSQLGVSQRGVDMYYYEQAVKDKKSIKGLESIDEHLNYVVSMADGNEDNFVSYSIEEMGTLADYFEILATAWRKGDSAKLDEVMVSDVKKKQPSLYRNLILKRNNSWLPLIDAQRKSNRTAFVLVGAAHLVGSDGLIEGLRKRGYKVDKL